MADSQKAMTPKEELASLDMQIDALESRREAIYRASVGAPESEKVCEDTFAKMLGEPAFTRKIQFPITVTGITGREVKSVMPGNRKVGAFVSIRPCDEACKGKTYLGIYLGDIALGTSVSFHKNTGVLAVDVGFHNPAIYVFDLKRVVFGAESWWGEIKSEADLRQITDLDINNIWYVRAAAEIGVKPTPLDSKS